MKESVESYPVNRVLIVMIMSLLYAAASLVLLGSDYRPMTVEIIITRYGVISLVILYMGYHFLKTRLQKQIKFSSFMSVHLLLSWFLFSLFVILSELSHKVFPLQGFSYLIIAPLIFFIMIPYVMQVATNLILIALLIANIGYLLASIIFQPLVLIPYSGILANPNGFGLVAAQAYIATLLLVLNNMKSTWYVRITLFMILGVSLTGVIFSASRTAFAAVTAVTVLFILMSNVFRSLKLRYYIYIIIGLILFAFTPIATIFMESIIGKYILFASQNDVLNGRSVIWGYVLQEMTVLGYGSDYFMERFKAGPHNNFIDVIGQFGIMAGIALFIFIGLSFIISIQYAIHNRKKDSLFLAPMIIVATFILFSMTEVTFGMIGQGITLAYFNMIGMMMITLKGRSHIDQEQGDRAT